MKPEGFKNLISFETAKKKLFSHTLRLKSETVSLDDACGRVLVEDVKSKIDVPHFAKSAMDGYAVRSSDVRGASEKKPVTLKLIDVVRAGSVSKKRVTVGTCIEIATGAQAPLGADSVVIVEDTKRVGSDVIVFTASEKAKHIIPTGSDIKKNKFLLKAGSILDAYNLGLLAAIGLSRVKVYAKPRIGLIATGNEIIVAGEPLEPGRIYGTNNLSIGALLKKIGADVADYGVCADVKGSLRRKLESALKKSDVVIISGGSSVGADDIVPDVVGELGKIIFHGIAIRPGKPVLFGLVKGKPVIGLPGNPTSALMVLNVFVLPYLCKSLNVSEDNLLVPAMLAEDFTFKKKLRYFLPVKLSKKGSKMYASPTFKGSNAISSVSDADGYISIPPKVSKIDRGSIVEVNLL